MATPTFQVKLLTLADIRRQIQWLVNDVLEALAPFVVPHSLDYLFDAANDYWRGETGTPWEAFWKTWNDFRANQLPGIMQAHPEGPDEIIETDLDDLDNLARAMQALLVQIWRQLAETLRAAGAPIATADGYDHLRGIRRAAAHATATADATARAIAATPTPAHYTEYNLTPWTDIPSHVTPAPPETITSRIVPPNARACGLLAQLVAGRFPPTRTNVGLVDAAAAAFAAAMTATGLPSAETITAELAAARTQWVDAWHEHNPAERVTAQAVYNIWRANEDLRFLLTNMNDPNGIITIWATNNFKRPRAIRTGFVPTRLVSHM